MDLDYSIKEHIHFSFIHAFFRHAERGGLPAGRRLSSTGSTLPSPSKILKVILPHVGYIFIAGSDLTLSCVQKVSGKGVYVWTHISTGNQYVGSSKNMKTRIRSYFSTSYHNGQLNRKGSGTLAISRVMLKYPNLQEWILEIYPTDDYLLLEQFCLDTFVCAFNIRRSATTGPYVPNTSPINVGPTNPQYGLTGTDSSHWGGLHSTEQRMNWSHERSGQYYIYDINTCLQIAGPICGLSGVANYLNMGARSVSDAFNLCKVVADKFIISDGLLNSAEVAARLALINKLKGGWSNEPLYVYNEKGTVLLSKFDSVKDYVSQYAPLLVSLRRLIILSLTYEGFLFKLEPILNADNTLNNVPSFVGVPKTKRVTRPIYGLNEETGEHKTWPSVRACLADLENNRNFNQNSLLLRIKHKQAYKGYLVAYESFDE